MRYHPDIVNAFERHVIHALADCGVAPGSHVGVALSGGADSVALLRALVTSDYQVTALHCNFSLRGDESDGDEAFCRELCAALCVDLVTVTFDTHALRHPGESIEMACRRLRYDWFEIQAKTLNLNTIAIAHHSEDSEETMFINLLRGTGPTGLKALAPRRGIYVRPMLALTRNDIIFYLSRLEQPYRTDSSNLSNDYRRNALRNSILPLIAQSFPEYRSGLANTADAMRHASALIDDFIKLAAGRFAVDGSIDVGRLKHEVRDPFATLYLLIPEVFHTKIGKQQVADILAVTGPETRRFTAEDGSPFELHRGILRPALGLLGDVVTFPLFEGITTPVTIKSSIISAEEFRALPKPKDGSVAFLDAAEFNQNSIATLRPWREGDRLKPYGMKGSRKLSDIFSDLHLSVSAKRQIRVVEYAGEIIWIPGIRASRLYSVTPDTRSVIVLTLH